MIKFGFQLIFLVLVLMALLFVLVRSIRKTDPKREKYQGILHIGEFNGKVNYNFEILIPLDEMEMMNFIRIKVDRRI